MNRIRVVGSTGSGKTTLGRHIAMRLDTPHLELDSIFHQADWQELDEHDFIERVTAFTDAERWVVDGNYSPVGDLITDKADTLIYLNYHLAFVLSRLIRRSLKRIMTKEVLWNGNQESWSALLSPNPKKNLILWMLFRHSQRRKLFTSQQFADDHLNLRIIILNDSGETEAFLTSLS